jgi:hypothetical protein
MHNRHFVISMTIEGEKVPGFSAVSLNLPPDGQDYSLQIVDRSRASYGVSREFVDRYVHERYLMEAPKSAPKPAAKPHVGATVTAAAERPAAVQSAETDDKPKRKRTRKRKKSASPAAASNERSGELTGTSGDISLK